MQQCRRVEVRKWLQKNQNESILNSQQTLRNRVTHFALKSKHKTLENYKENYEKVLHREDKKSWTDYWNGMVKCGSWVDSVFVQATAWFMGLDIFILTTSATPAKPFIHISGNMNSSSDPSPGPPLVLGNYTNVHYQSLLPVNGLSTINIHAYAEQNQEEQEEIWLHQG